MKKVAAAVQKRKRNKLIRKVLQCSPLYLMMIPGLIYIFINNYIPMAGIIIAFKKMNYSLGKWSIFLSPWVGLDNFKFLLKTKDAWLITRNTVGYNLAFIITGLLVNVTVAILLNEIRSDKLKKIYQIIILIPVMLSIVIISYVLFGFLSQENGFINNSILALFGIDKVSWYAKPEYWPVIIVLVNVWKGFGYGSIVYFAVLVGIDKEYYEAAALDGAGRWKQMLHISLPALRPTISILTLLAVSKLFNSDMGLFYQLTRGNGQLIPTTQTIDTYVYRGLVDQGNVTMTSAANFYQAVVGFVLVLTFNLIVKKLDSESALF